MNLKIFTISIFMLAGCSSTSKSFSALCEQNPEVVDPLWVGELVESNSVAGFLGGLSSECASTIIEAYYEAIALGGNVYEFSSLRTGEFGGGGYVVIDDKNNVLWFIWTWVH